MEAKKKENYNFLIHPGETLLEMLEEKDLTQKELSIRAGLSEKHISQIINGVAPISCETALKLEQVLSMPASFWNALESNYRAEKIRLEEKLNIKKEEYDIFEMFPYKDLVDKNYLKKVKDKEEKILQLRKLLNVSSLLAVNQLATKGMAFRKTNINNLNIYSVFAWIRICEIETQSRSSNELNLSFIKKNLPKIKELVAMGDINKSIKTLTDIFDEAGVTFKVMPHLKGAPIQGMIRKSDGKYTLILTIRNKFADIFWFSLAHEIGHLLNDNLDNFFVDFDKSSREDNPKEERADKFATEFLIDTADFSNFIKKNDFSKQAILKFSEDQKTIPGIIVGRLQHDGIIKMNQHHDLRLKYEWA